MKKFLCIAFFYLFIFNVNAQTVFLWSVTPDYYKDVAAAIPIPNGIVLECQISLAFFPAGTTSKKQK
jgi:hypothetical protein